MHDLLNDPLIGIRTAVGRDEVSVPQLLARLSVGGVEGYTGLRPHQADPWHVFLVQIAASVLARRSQIDPNRPPTDAGFWRDGLLELAEGQTSAWHLLVERVDRPAFMQHPLKGGSVELRKAFKPKAHSPDELDVLVTAKNHDLKIARMQTTAIEAWLFALVSSQTTSGYLGSGHYGTVRMNSGAGSRPIVSLVRSVRPDARFTEELSIMCQARADIIAQHQYAERGVVLTWLQSWTRDDHQYTVSRLEPWFVEAVQPVRLVQSTDKWIAMGAPSKARLIGPKELDNGVVGDLWIPVNETDKKKGRSALTLSAAGWTPERLTDLLFEQGFRLTSLQKARPGAGDLWFIGSTIVRGQGTTNGFHEFMVPVPAKVRAALFVPEAAQSLATYARELLKHAADAGWSLHAGLMALAEGGPEADVIDKKDKKDKKVIAAWAEQVRAETTRSWRDRYFPTLWRAVDPTVRDAIKSQWKADLVANARSTLRQAVQRLPTPSARRWRASIRARWVLDASLRKAALLPDREIGNEAAFDEEETA